MIYALGDISGGHFNPAVTFAIMLSGRDKMEGWGMAGMYMLAQFAGACCAALIYSVVYLGDTFGLSPQNHHSMLDALGAEVLFTGLLCFVVLGMATTYKA